MIPTLQQGFFPLRGPTPQLGFPYSEDKLTGIADGTIPTREHNKHTKPSMHQIKYPGVKDKHYEETQSISNKTDGKVNQARFIQIFSFQIQIFIPNLFISITLLDYT